MAMGNLNLYSLIIKEKSLSLVVSRRLPSFRVDPNQSLGLALGLEGLLVAIGLFLIIILLLLCHSNSSSLIVGLHGG